MSEMVDRVAAALFEVEFGKDTTGWMEKADFRESYRRQARIAIEAMREPTEAMIYSGMQALSWAEGPSHDDLRGAYEDMIGAALA